MKALLAIAVLLMSSGSAATQTCLTKSQARVAWPDEYIQYRVRQGRQCWFATGKAHVVPALPVPSPVPKEPDPEPLPTWLIQQPLPPRDLSLWYPPERGNLPPEIVYSTFPDPPPDVWPTPSFDEPQPLPAFWTWALIGAGCGAVFAFGLAFAASMQFFRQTRWIT
jgi:hypothetical protein